MGPRRTLLLLLALGWALMASGCAGVVEFQMPDQYKDKKLKEDPPGSYLAPTGPDRTGAC
ncbi:MAG TPA: hypothetical protein VK842_05855 [bacterium]|nr:hypothetical protein [bacterium]